MEIIEATPIEEVVKKVEMCEICDLPSTEIPIFSCDKKECELCQLTFDKFVCTVCTHTKSLEEMEKIYIEKNCLQTDKEEVESGIEVTVSSSNSPDVTTESFSAVENISVNESSESEEDDVNDLPDEEVIEYSILETRELVRVRRHVEAPFVERKIPLCGKDEEIEEDKVEGKENLLKVVKAISELNSEQDRLICSVDAENGDAEESNEPKSPGFLTRQNGFIDEKVTEKIIVPEVEALNYKGEINVEEEKGFFNEETEVTEEELIAEEEKIQKLVNQTEVYYYEDYQEDSGNESDVFVDTDNVTHKVEYSDEILEKIPEDDENASVLAENLVEDTLLATSKSYAKILEHQDSMISNASMDKYVEERDFSSNKGSYFIRGTSLEHPMERSKAIEPEDYIEVSRPMTRANSVSSFSSDDDESSEGSEYENEYYPLYDHIKNQKVVNRDIRLLRSMLEEKFKIKIYGCEIEEIVRVKEEVLNRFGIDLGYHQVYNYMEKNELKKLEKEAIGMAIKFFQDQGLEMIESVRETETKLNDQDLEERIQKICEYVSNDKTIDDLDDDEITSEAAKIASKFIDNIEDKSEQRRSWRQKQADIIDLMEEYRRKCNKVRFEEEEVTRLQTPVSLRATPVSNDAKLIHEDVERVRKSFGHSHDIKINAMIQITDDMREKIAKLADEFPGKIRFEIETIPKVASKLVTSLKEDIIEDVSAATNFIEKTPIVQEKFDFTNFFRNLFKLKTNTTNEVV